MAALNGSVGSPDPKIFTGPVFIRFSGHESAEFAAIAEREDRALGAPAVAADLFGIGDKTLGYLQNNYCLTAIQVLPQPVQRGVLEQLDRDMASGTLSPAPPVPGPPIPAQLSESQRSSVQTLMDELSIGDRHEVATRVTRLGLVVMMTFVVNEILVPSEEIVDRPIGFTMRFVGSALLSYLFTGGLPPGACSP